MPPIPPPRDSGFTTTTDVPLFWARYGPAGASRILLLHGGPGADHRYLLPQMLRLAERHELVTYDQRGGGQSRSDDRAPITADVHVADLARVAAELAPGPVTLVGYSWGGLLALLYAIHARRGSVPPVARLVLVDPAPVTRTFRTMFEAEFAQRQSSPAVLALRDELARSGLRERDPEAYRQRAFELSVAGYFADPARARDLTPFRVVGRVQQQVWESLGDYDLLPAAAGLDVPTLIVHGREDPIPLASSAALGRVLPAPLVVLDACGHVPYVEQPERLFASVLPFLDVAPVG